MISLYKLNSSITTMNNDKKKSIIILRDSSKEPFHRA